MKKAKETAKIRELIGIPKKVIFICFHCFHCFLLFFSAFSFFSVFSFFSLIMPVSATAAGMSDVNHTHTSDTPPSSVSTVGTFSTAVDSRNLFNNQKQKMDKPYELVLFYSASCSYCFQFCRTLKDYALQNKISVIAFKLTQKASPYFPNSILVDRRTIEQYFGQGVQIAVPALFVLNPNNMHLYPVSRGNLTSNELKMRMDDLMQKIRVFEMAKGAERAERTGRINHA